MKCPYCGKEKFVTGTGCSVCWNYGVSFEKQSGISRNLRKLWHDCAVLCEKAGKIA